MTIGRLLLRAFVSFSLKSVISSYKPEMKIKDFTIRAATHLRIHVLLRCCSWCISPLWPSLISAVSSSALCQPLLQSSFCGLPLHHWLVGFSYFLNLYQFVFYLLLFFFFFFCNGICFLELLTFWENMPFLLIFII